MPFKDTLVVNLIAPELMGHVAIPYTWKEFLFHRGCSYDVTSILKSGLIAGGRESEEGGQTIFFTPLSPFGDNPDQEEPSDDFSKPRKVQYHCKLKKYSARRLLDQFSPSTRQRTTVLANQIPCRNCIQLCACSLKKGE